MIDGIPFWASMLEANLALPPVLQFMWIFYTPFNYYQRD